MQKLEKFEIRTDLALEANEQVNKSDTKLKGIIVKEDHNKKLGVLVTRLTVTNKMGEKAINKPMGNYITIESQKLASGDEEYNNQISEIIAKNILELIKEHLTKKKLSILVVGLGNRDVTPDSLGPDVVDNIFIDRHYNEEGDIVLSGMVPGVMAQTGMETAEIIKGIVNEAKPDIVIAIDALAARNSSRLNTTVQLSDKGIHPGSGVGNHRTGITQETIGVPVIAIGVPTVIDAPTIVNDTMENLIKAFSTSKELQGLVKTLSDFTPTEKYNLIKEIISPEMADMYVTPKDVDATIKRIGYTLSDAINIAAGKK
ncbi:GPR endopeptidase [[Clostridium] fimetarium]|uniref:Germination protease n=1 Tax=[Clostridium] fimetarium TaxID=99656 RepID=A0A1I0QYJ7_9FIRM|nr:GPR endopeptidase [[Clostridium] fimetarium]SEW32702.1 spore protease [[Clostridium] fimetarium]